MVWHQNTLGNAVPITPVTGRRRSECTVAHQENRRTPQHLIAVSSSGTCPARPSCTNLFEFRLVDVASSHRRPGTAARASAPPCPTVYSSDPPWQSTRRQPQICRSALTRSAEAVLETSYRDSRRRATEQGRRRALGRALSLGAHLSLRRWLGHESNCGFSIRWLRSEFGRMGPCRCQGGMFRLGCCRLGLRRGWLDRRLVVCHWGLILALRSEQIVYEATDAA
jgi:hypothetical protein